MSTHGWLFPALSAAHIIAVISWLGAMYFNLVLLFPMYRGEGPDAYLRLMQAQGTRAGRPLYLFIALTAGTGILLSMQELGDYPMKSWVWTKIGLWAGMLALHLYGTVSLWPRIHLSLPSEAVSLFNK